MECPENNVRTGHDERSRHDEPFQPLLWAHQRFLHDLNEAPAAVDPDFMRAVSKSIHEVYPDGSLTEDEYFRLPHVMAAMDDLKYAVELSFPATGHMPYSGPRIPAREVIHALRLGHPHGRLPDVVRYSLMVLRQEHLLEIPLALERSRRGSNANESSRAAPSPGLRPPCNDDNRGHAPPKSPKGPVDMDKTDTSTKERTPSSVIVVDTSISAIVPPDQYDSNKSWTSRRSNSPPPQGRLRRDRRGRRERTGKGSQERSNARLTSSERVYRDMMQLCTCFGYDEGNPSCSIHSREQGR
ncbi:hypothetical protein CC79DRAFT_475327 [Sarocladium strictum]